MISCSCGADTRVTETRATPAGARRRRACMRCDEKFTTYEVRVPDAFGNSIKGRGRLRIVGEADVDRLRDALGSLLESIHTTPGTPTLHKKDSQDMNYVLLTALIAGCSTDPSVHVPPDAPTPLCADVPACHDQLCRIDPSGDPMYCECGGVRCLKGDGQ